MAAAAGSRLSMFGPLSEDRFRMTSDVDIAVGGIEAESHAVFGAAEHVPVARCAIPAAIAEVTAAARSIGLAPQAPD